MILNGIAAAANVLAPLAFGIYDRIHGKNEADRNQGNIDWNKEFSNKQFDYMELENEKTRAREDNAIQRRVKDLEAAGLNPLLAAGSPGASAQAMSTAGTATAPGTPTRPTPAPVMDFARSAQIAAEIDLMRAQAQNQRDQGQAALKQAGASESMSSSAADQTQADKIFKEQQIEQFMEQNKISREAVEATKLGQKTVERASNYMADIQLKRAEIEDTTKRDVERAKLRQELILQLNDQEIARNAQALLSRMNEAEIQQFMKENKIRDREMVLKFITEMFKSAAIIAASGAINTALGPAAKVIKGFH